jgi:hypothetical protein
MRRANNRGSANAETDGDRIDDVEYRFGQPNGCDSIRSKLRDKKYIDHSE